MTPAIQARGLERSFGAGAGEIRVLRGVDLEVARGESVAVMGRSGVGKTTLLHVLGALDVPDAGELRLLGKDLGGFSEREGAAFRNRNVGFVFQHHRLLPELTAVENVSMPLRIRRVPRDRAEETALGLLDELGLADRAGHRSEELSGGEQQRVAVARAICGEPSVLLADEPTGNLDDRSSQVLVELLASLHERRGLTTVVATHSAQVALRCDSTYRLTGGVLEPTVLEPTGPEPAPVLNSGSIASP